MISEPKSKRITMNINWRLPSHIIQVIFSKLPTLNFLVCRLVCKSWNDLILNHPSTCKNSFFLCAYPKMHCIDFDPKYLGGMSYVASVTFQDDSPESYIINSCNGLLFVFKFGRVTDCLGILNPVTNEYIKLPGGNDSYEDDEQFYRRTKNSYSYGFGFSPNTKRYKVARVSRDPKKSIAIIDIFTFGGSNQWRSCVDSVPFFIKNDGVYLHGALHWIGIDNRNGDYKYVICRWDVEKEKIETTIALTEVGPSRKVTIQAFNGSVYATFFFMYPCYKIEVWRMQNYGGREDSWTRDFVMNDIKAWVTPIRLLVFFKLIKLYEDGEILCLVNYTSFILYNPKLGRIKTLNQVEQRFTCFGEVDSFNFGSLQKILAGDDG